MSKNTWGRRRESERTCGRSPQTGPQTEGGRAQRPCPHHTSPSSCPPSVLSSSSLTLCVLGSSLRRQPFPSFPAWLILSSTASSRCSSRTAPPASPTRMNTHQSHIFDTRPWARPSLLPLSLLSPHRAGLDFPRASGTFSFEQAQAPGIGVGHATSSACRRATCSTFQTCSPRHHMDLTTCHLRLCSVLQFGDSCHPASTGLPSFSSPSVLKTTYLTTLWLFLKHSFDHTCGRHICHLRSPYHAPGTVLGSGTDPRNEAQRALRAPPRVHERQPP